MMISVQPRTDTRHGMFLAAVLIAGMSIGFVAGQAAPDLVGAIGNSSAVTTSGTTLSAGGELSDYGLRHGPVQVISRSDDYGLRHPTTAVVGREDDYGLRHAP
jgi:hypothetical protein